MTFTTGVLISSATLRNFGKFNVFSLLQSFSFLCLFWSSAKQSAQSSQHDGHLVKLERIFFCRFFGHHSLVSIEHIGDEKRAKRLGQSLCPLDHCHGAEGKEFRSRPEIPGSCFRLYTFDAKPTFLGTRTILLLREPKVRIAKLTKIFAPSWRTPCLVENCLDAFAHSHRYKPQMRHAAGLKGFVYGRESQVLFVNPVQSIE